MNMQYADEKKTDGLHKLKILSFSTFNTNFTTETDCVITITINELVH